MPETTVLYAVTGVVVVGLVAWVAAALKLNKEPWARLHEPAPEAGLGEAGAPGALEVSEGSAEGQPVSKEPPVDR
jgi:hypothetical protein